MLAIDCSILKHKPNVFTNGSVENKWKSWTQGFPQSMAMTSNFNTDHNHAIHTTQLFTCKYFLHWIISWKKKKIPIRQGILYHEVELNTSHTYRHLSQCVGHFSDISTILQYKIIFRVSWTYFWVLTINFFLCTHAALRNVLNFTYKFITG